MNDVPTSSQGETPTPAPLLAGRYLLGQRLGSAVDVTLMEAHDTRLDRAVVVRLVHPELSAVAEVQQRFKSLLLSLERIQHPNLPAIYDFGRAPWNGQTVLYTVGERLTGGSLRDLLDRGRLLTPSQAVVVGLDACKALDALHRGGVVHGDVRPSTLVFGADGRLRVTDPGLMAMLDDFTGGAGTITNDVAKYASPEVALGAERVAQSDVYSLCLSLIEALTGAVPFAGASTVATLGNRVGKLLPVSADYGSLAAVFERAGRPNAHERSTPVEFARALVQAAGSMPAPTPLRLVGAPVDGADTPVAEMVEAVSEPATETIEVVNPELAALVLGDGTSEVPVIAPLDPTGNDISAVLPFTQRRRRRGVLVSVVLLVVAAVAGGVAYTVTRTEHRTVPMVVGLDEGEALNQLAEGFVATVQKVASDQVNAGLVIDTDPAAGVSLNKGAAIVVHVSSGPTLRPLPAVAGLTVTAANSALEAQGLVAKVADPVFDETVEKGMVLRWSVPGSPAVVAGTQVPKGTTVEIVPSAGPAPRTIPALVGLPVAKARALLEGLQLVVSIAADPVFHPTAKVGTIATAAPAAGQAVARGSTVVLAISKGPDLVEIPSPKGISPMQFAASLIEAGFKVGTITGTPRWVIPTLAVKGKAVKPGDKVLRGSTVDITYPRR